VVGVSLEGRCSCGAGGEGGGGGGGFLGLLLQHKTEEEDLGKDPIFEVYTQALSKM